MPSKVGQLSLIGWEIYHCTKCALHENRTNTVPGAGDPHAEILFIGEAPGENEDEQGLPFVGRSGKYLEELLAMVGLTREEVFIANVVKCRPPGNRDPLSEEIATCNPYLRRQIQTIDPLVIATLGRHSMNLFFTNAKISQIHGQARFGRSRAYFPLFHPAAILRNPNQRSMMEADFNKLIDVLAEVRRKRASGEMQASPDEDTLQEEMIVPGETKKDDGPQQMGLFGE